jgi:thiopeptide-type bacteriocin biosynthesis protein
MRARDHQWLSVHLAFPRSSAGDGDVYGPAADRVLAGAVAPLVVRLREQRRASRCFFIRYQDGGPHVRLRVRAHPAEHARLTAEIEAACEALVAGPAGEPWSVQARVARYEPELTRYGGLAGIDVSERLFEASSDLVLGLLPVLSRAGGDRDLRLGHAVLGVVLLAGAFIADEPRTELVGFLDRYGAGGVARPWSPPDREAFEAELARLTERQDRLSASMAGLFDAARFPERLPEPLARAAGEFGAARRGLLGAWHRGPFVIHGRPTRSPRHAIRRLAPSYVHMHLNRQGVRPEQEALVARIAARVLREGGVPA